MQKSTIRVLLVDDFEPSRSWVRSKLKVQEHLHIVGEAFDGLEAVQKAQELIPDLILLDIGLPNLNGIRAADRIQHVVPGAKILYLSQEHDIDIVRTALSNGAKGYLLKAAAESELLPAIEAVLGGEKFVSRCLNI